MARGWESKSVEAQIEESLSESSGNKTLADSAEELQSRNKKDSLTLSCKRVLEQLDRSTDERYCEQLRQSLAYLYAQIAALP